MWIRIPKDQFLIHHGGNLVHPWMWDQCASHLFLVPVLFIFSVQLPEVSSLEGNWGPREMQDWVCPSSFTLGPNLEWRQWAHGEAAKAYGLWAILVTNQEKKEVRGDPVPYISCGGCLVCMDNDLFQFGHIQTHPHSCSGHELSKTEKKSEHTPSGTCPRVFLFLVIHWQHSSWVPATSGQRKAPE